MSAYFKQIKRVRALALVLLLIAVLIFPPFGRFFLPSADAALTNAKLQINNSQASATNVTYTFYFTTSVTTSIKQIGIKICTTPGAYGDACTVPASFSPGSPTLASDNIAGTGRTVTDPNSSGERMRIVVGTPASQATQNMQLTFTGLTNSATADTTFYTRITTFSDTGSTPIDYGQAAAATLDLASLAVTATVDPNFTFALAGVTNGASVNSATTNIDTSGNANTIPFGTMTVGSSKIAATDVTVTTNAGGGYTVTASHSGALVSSPPLTSGANDIDAFSGTNATPTSWSAPAGSTANTNTGYFGYTTEDGSLCTGTSGRFTSNTWAGSTTTGQEVICSASGVSAQTTRLGWQAQVNAIQPAGGYSGTVILIATPTY